MALELTPLDMQALSAAAQRALGPGPGRMMASRGMMPLPPADQVAVLYQLSLDADISISGAARATANGLPEKLLVGTLADTKLDPRVLHFFAGMFADRPAVFDAIVLNPKIADQTIAVLAQKGGAREVDQIAQNEQALLRHPEIIAAMYMNRKARMSTIDRVVELAVRNDVKVPGIACWDEISRALMSDGASSPEDEAIFQAATAEKTDDSVLTQGDAEAVISEEEAAAAIEKAASKTKVSLDKLSVPAKIRLATLGDGPMRAQLIRDPLKIVAMAAIKSPGVTDSEAARYAANASLGEEIIRHISQKREWTKMYGVKVSLCRNPKTPIPESTKLLPFLREKDLTAISKSRGVPSAVVSQARKLIMQRRGGDKK
jgi:hypothetical protein